MKTQTIQLPCNPVVNGLPAMHEFTGETIGKMFVHKDWPDSSFNSCRGNWTVTHLKSGFAVKKGIGSRARAVWLAKQLSAMGCWDFSDARASKDIHPAALTYIKCLLKESA